MKRICIEVPATSAGLGPGIETLGLALDLVDVVRVEIDRERSEIEAPHDEGLLASAYRAWPADGTLPGARFSLERRIPDNQGLGDQVAPLVAGLAAAAYATDSKNSRQQIMRLATDLSGELPHVAAATLGGMTTAFQDGDTVQGMHVANHLLLGVALFLPEDADGRAKLPAEVRLATAAADLGRLAYLTSALMLGRWHCIGPAMESCLADPSMPESAREVLATAREAGAYGAAPSGRGPALIALTPYGEAEQVAAAMEERASRLGWAGRSLVTGVREMGVLVKEEK